MGNGIIKKLSCEVDRRFFPEAFPGLIFHRGNSWEKTIVYGKDHCEFVFEKKEAIWEQNIFSAKDLRQ
jgi:hypothetical protein